ncbi:hypothetical protein Tco_0982003 [Tanacetum coccineum]
MWNTIKGDDRCGVEVVGLRLRMWFSVLGLVGVLVGFQWYGRFEGLRLVGSHGGLNSRGGGPVGIEGVRLMWRVWRGGGWLVVPELVEVDTVRWGLCVMGGYWSAMVQGCGMGYLVMRMVESGIEEGLLDRGLDPCMRLGCVGRGFVGSHGGWWRSAFDEFSEGWVGAGFGLSGSVGVDGSGRGVEGGLKGCRGWAGWGLRVRLGLVESVEGLGMVGVESGLRLEWRGFYLERRGVFGLRCAMIAFAITQDVSFPYTVKVSS